MTGADLCRLLAVLVPLSACLVWAYHLVRRYRALPDSLAVHFSLAGRPNGWMSRRFFALLTVATLSLVLGSSTSSVLRLPAALFSRPLPPPASVGTTLGIALAVAAFFEVTRVAISSDPPQLRWSRILPWPAILLALQVLLAAIALHT